MELKTIFFSGLVIFNNYRMFTFLVSNSNVDYRLVEKYFPNIVVGPLLSGNSRVQQGIGLISADN
jgi:hypothetical protein